MTAVADCVKIDAYLADPDTGRLLRVADVRTVQGVRVAMLEDAVTEEIEPWPLRDAADLRLARRSGA